MALPPSRETPVWLITGCSTGFGRRLAKILVERGYRVAATARDRDKIADIAAGHDETAPALTLDVEKPAEIEAAVADARRAFGRIDVLVNNAGYGYLAAIEEGDDSDIRAMFETNFFGLAAMTRAVLPVMRAQKSGAIVNISSMGGFIGIRAWAITPRPSSPSRASPNLSPRRSRNSGSGSSSSSPARSAPTGPAAR